MKPADQSVIAIAKFSLESPNRCHYSLSRA